MMIFNLQLVLDRLVASRDVRRRAMCRARYAHARHGVDAMGSLRSKLADPRRRRSLRELRLALHQLASST